MDIRILHGIQEAGDARGVTVVIDVFRAFSTVCHVLGAGAEAVLPVARKELAYELKRENPEYLLMGERDAIKLPGFDYGNSPTEVEGADFSGRSVVLTTSAGTQGLFGAVAAEEILTGAFVNAAATAEYVRAADPDALSLLAMGTGGLEESEEDTLYAEYLAALLQGSPRDFGAIRKRLKDIASADKFFDPAMEHAPERDFELCTDLDAFDFAVRLEGAEEGSARLVKVWTPPGR
jgi:2-phosphosulfolactate phosphatase